MIQCEDCGAPCGTLYPASHGIFNNGRFVCGKCHRARQSNAIKAFGGFWFLAGAVVTAIVFTLFILKPMAASSGYDTARSVAIGIGIGGIVSYFILRFIANRNSGCLFRMVLKIAGWLLYTLGIGLLVSTFVLEDSMKGLMGVKDGAAPVAEVSSEEPAQLAE